MMMNTLDAMLTFVEFTWLSKIIEPYLVIALLVLLVGFELGSSISCNVMNSYICVVVIS